MFKFKYGPEFETHYFFIRVSISTQVLNDDEFFFSALNKNRGKQVNCNRLFKNQTGKLDFLGKSFLFLWKMFHAICFYFLPNPRLIFFCCLKLHWMLNIQVIYFRVFFLFRFFLSLLKTFLCSAQMASWLYLVVVHTMENIFMSQKRSRTWV